MGRTDGEEKGELVHRCVEGGRGTGGSSLMGPDGLEGSRHLESPRLCHGRRSGCLSRVNTRRDCLGNDTSHRKRWNNESKETREKET